MKKCFLILFTVFTLPYAGKAQCTEFGAELLWQLIYTMEEGGPQLKMTQFGQQAVPLFGLKGGWYLNDHVVIGLGAYGTVTTLSNPDFTSRYFNYGYIGSYIDIRHRPYDPIHFSTSFFLGYGDADGLDFRRQSDFWVFEPEASVLFQITDEFKIGLGSSYRAYLNYPEIANSSMSRFNMNLSLIFGGY